MGKSRKNWAQCKWCLVGGVVSLALWVLLWFCFSHTLARLAVGNDRREDEDEATATERARSPGVQTQKKSTRRRHDETVEGVATHSQAVPAQDKVHDRPAADEGESVDMGGKDGAKSERRRRKKNSVLSLNSSELANTPLQHQFDLITQKILKFKSSKASNSANPPPNFPPNFPPFAFPIPGSKIIDNTGEIDDAITEKEREKERVPLIIALAVDLNQLDGALVAINSALQNAQHPKRLKFRIITLATYANAVLTSLKSRLPAVAKVECVHFDPWLPRVSKLLGGESSDREELFNALNFAAFYLHEVFPYSRRVLYFDTDVVVLQDLLEELEYIKMKKPVAGAKDCSQHLDKYVFMKHLYSEQVVNQVPFELRATKRSCVVNRGVMLVDTVLWNESKITEGIEQLVKIHTSTDGPLWRSGVSQPPFLVATAGRIHNLGVEYNVRGLGRKTLTPKELRFYREKKMWTPYLDQFLRACESQCCKDKRVVICHLFAPHIVPHAHLAKVVHFNGALKPQNRAPRSSQPKKSPGVMSKKLRMLYEKRPLCTCGPTCVRECAGLWWHYLPKSKSTKLLLSATVNLTTAKPLGGGMKDHASTQHVDRDNLQDINDKVEALLQRLSAANTEAEVEETAEKDDVNSGDATSTENEEVENAETEEDENAETEDDAKDDLTDEEKIEEDENNEDGGAVDSEDGIVDAGEKAELNV